MSQGRVFWICSSLMLVAVGVSFLISYPIYLFGHTDLLGRNSAFTYYMAATAGAMALAWGFALFHAADDSRSRLALALPSAAGFAMLSLMRLITLPFGNYVLDFIPSSAVAFSLSLFESIVFGGLAYGFWRESRRS